MRRKYLQHKYKRLVDLIYRSLINLKENDKYSIKHTYIQSTLTTDRKKKYKCLVNIEKKFPI